MKPKIGYNISFVRFYGFVNFHSQIPSFVVFPNLSLLQIKSVKWIFNIPELLVADKSVYLCGF